MLPGLYFEINVSWNGQHFFATAPKSLTDAARARAVFEDLYKRYPKGEGYEITVTKWETTGTKLEWTK